jgi:hypothetical protein
MFDVNELSMFMSLIEIGFVSLFRKLSSALIMVQNNVVRRLRSIGEANGRSQRKRKNENHRSSTDDGRRTIVVPWVTHD